VSPCRQAACRGFITSTSRGGGGLPCLAGLAPDSQRRHRKRRSAYNAGRRGRCSARDDEAFGRTAREWCRACAVRLDPCSSSDLLARTQGQSGDKRRKGLPEVGFQCCIPNAPALSRTIGRLSPVASRVRAEPQAAPATHFFLASPCDGVVPRRAVRTLGFGKRSGHGAFPHPPERRSLRTTVAPALQPTAPIRAGPAHAAPTSARNATWLILPVVICLSQRLSHACVSMNKFRL
jgi:hypothetical protein